MQMQVSNLDFLVGVFVCEWVWVRWKVLGLRLVSVYHDCFVKFCWGYVCIVGVYLCLCRQGGKQSVCLTEVFANTEELEVQIKPLSIPV